MKQKIALFLALILTLGMFAVGCQKQETDESTASTAVTESSEATETVSEGEPIDAAKIPGTWESTSILLIGQAVPMEAAEAGFDVLMNLDADGTGNFILKDTAGTASDVEIPVVWKVEKSMLSVQVPKEDAKACNLGEETIDMAAYFDGETLVMDQWMNIDYGFLFEQVK